MKSPSALLSQRRPRQAHKGQFGHVLVIGGCAGMGGSVQLAAEAAARVGSGLVSIATDPGHAAHIGAAVPEVMCHAVETAEQLKPLLSRASVIVAGPGLGQGNWGESLYHAVMQSELPLVLDADGLNLLAKNAARRGNWVLTPHPGEASRLLNAGASDVQENRTGAVSELANQYDAVVVLKGMGTLVAEMEYPVRKFDLGNPGMASGGMGDVLAGIIGGFIAQGMTLYEAACSAVYIHAHAGDRAAEKGGERGMLARDLIAELREMVNAFDQ
ncbi:MAG: NAD(P)H-hydrate dehydratase [Gammaproteobacteria bacterium]